MGMFDSVYATCPKCGEEVKFQSKAGECQLRNYSINSVPPEIARDIDGDTQTCQCGEVLRITVTQPIARVQMTITNTRDREWD